MYQLDKPQRIDKSFAITSIVEKGLIQNDMVIEDQYIEISGYASRMYKDGAYVIDADGENVNTFGFDLKRLVNGTLPLLYNHDKDKPVGKILSATYDKEGLLITAKLFKYPDDELTNFVYYSVKNKVISAFSVGMLVKNFDVISQEGEDYLQLSDSEIIEISLVPIPSNPEALFDIVSMKSLDSDSMSTKTLISKSALKVENPDACSGLECAIKSKQLAEEQKVNDMNKKEVEVVPEIIVPVEEKETVLGVTETALNTLDEINKPVDTPALAEDSKPVEGETVTPELQDSSNVDSSNDKPSTSPKDDMADIVPTLIDNLNLVSGIDVSQLSDDEMEQVYEALAPIMDKIGERVVNQVADVLRTSMTVTPA